MDQTAGPEYLSLRQAAKELGKDRRWLAGHLAALGVPLMPLGNALAVRREDVARVRHTLASHHALTD